MICDIDDVQGSSDVLGHANHGGQMKNQVMVLDEPVHQLGIAYVATDVLPWRLPGGRLSRVQHRHPGAVTLERLT